ncbi:MAG: AraC family transcriptional regulator [Bacteroidales bacterium]|nr:AraC family transcriptional regulator [Bacteroidales bacterium]
MPGITDITSHREKISDVTDRFAIKNFVLNDASLIVPDQSLDESFIFNGFVLAMCLKGEANLRINYRDFLLKEGHIFTYMPNQISRVLKRSDDFLIENLFLASDYVLQLPLPKDFDLLKKISLEPVQKIKPEAMHNMFELHSLIAKHHRRKDNPHKELQTKSLIFALLMEVAAVYSNAAPQIPSAVSRQEVLTDNFFKIMLKDFKKERSVAYYANKLCLTPKYLSMTVKKITGHPISEWINEAVTIEAKRMLKATNMTALQISEELNFPNPSFFGRFFKQYAGMTPLQYKNS